MTNGTPSNPVDLKFVSALCGQSDATECARRRARKAAASDCPVLLIGERGSGRAELARAIHCSSSRHRGPFVRWRVGEFAGGAGRDDGAPSAGRAAAAPEFLVQQMVEAADGGTLYVDDVARLPGSHQAELRQLLERGTLDAAGGRGEQLYDVRVVAGIEQPLDETVEAGRLRDDLAYCLGVITIELPLPHWGPEDSSSNGRDEPSEDQTLAAMERTAIDRALEHYEGNRTRAARSLGISVRTLQRKLKRSGLPDP